MIHEAKMIVDEAGTKAAATTVATGLAGMAAPRPEQDPPVDVLAVHPFRYYLRYRRWILFDGWYL